MVGGENLDPLKVKDPPAERSNFGICLKKRLGSKSPQGTDDVGLNGLDLLHQKRRTTPDLIGLWVPILRRAAFDDIGDVDLLSLEMNGLNDLGQKLPRLSDKRSSLNIFF